jgi:hypothetical protein
VITIICYDGSFGDLLVTAEGYGYIEPIFPCPRYDDADAVEEDIHEWARQNNFELKINEFII